MEIQILNNVDLIKNKVLSRKIDLNQIEKGIYYIDLKDIYVIFYVVLILLI